MPALLDLTNYEKNLTFFQASSYVAFREPAIATDGCTIELTTGYVNKCLGITWATMAIRSANDSTGFHGCNTRLIHEFETPKNHPMGSVKL